jgi:hypothetical protein
MAKLCRGIFVIAVITVCVAGLNVGSSFAADKPLPEVEITAEEIADTPTPMVPQQQGEHFTIGSTKDDVERIQGKPDEKYFDGNNMIWYYGKDAVYFDFYDRVNGVDNKSGNLKVD